MEHDFAKHIYKCMFYSTFNNNNKNNNKNNLKLKLKIKIKNKEGCRGGEGSGKFVDSYLYNIW